MIVRFDAKVGTFIMMGEFATPLIKMMGHSGTIPSALLAPDIPRALTSLRKALDSVPETPPDADSDDSEDEREPAVSLRQRAYPLIDLLKRAADARCDVLWSVEPPGSART